MIEAIGEWWIVIRDFLADEKNKTAIEVLLSILAAAGVVYLYVTGRLAKLISLVRGKKDEEGKSSTVLTSIPPGAAGVMTLTLEEYEARLQRRGEEIAARLVGASEEDRTRLESEKSELASRLADIESSYAKAQEIITGLRETAERYGNVLGAEKLEEARRIFEEGDFDAADALFARVEDAGELEVERTAAAAFQRGKIAEEQVRWADAAAHYAKAARLAPGYDRLNKAQQFHWRAGQLHEAARWAGELVDLAKTEIGEDQPQTATALNNLGTIYKDMARYDEAEPLYRQALEIDAKTIGTAHPDYAIHLSNLALLLQDMERHDEAEPLYRQAMEIGEKTIGTAHPDYATDLNNLAIFLEQQGKFDEVRELYSKALSIRQSRLGDSHPNTTKNASDYADFLIKHGEGPEDAAALAELETAFGPDIGR